MLRLTAEGDGNDRDSFTNLERPNDHVKGSEREEMEMIFLISVEGFVREQGQNVYKKNRRPRQVQRF